jgi:hypothetical protein
MTEFKHGEMVCNAGELFYVRVTSEGEKTFQPVNASQHRYLPERATVPVLQAARGNLFSFSKIPGGTLFTMKKGYLVKHGDYMLGVSLRTEGDSQLEKFTTAALNEKDILAILYPPMPKEPPGQTLTERLVYLISSECWGLVDEAGYTVMELTPEKETWRLRHRDYKTYQQVLDYAPEVSYKLFRRLPLGTKVRDPKTYTLTHEDKGFHFNGDRLAPHIEGRWKNYFQEVVGLPTEYSLSSYKAVSPEDLLWSKTLKCWVEKPFAGDDAKSLVTGEGGLTDAGRSKPFSKIAKLDKAKKDTKKLNKLPVGTLITDGSCDTWERKAEGLVFGHHLKLAEEPFYSFDKYMIEIPKS